MLIKQFHTTKIIIIQIHTSSVWRKCMSYNFHTFLKNNLKKLHHFAGFLRTVEQTGDKKTDLKYFFEKKCFPYSFHIWKLYDWHFLMATQKNFSSKFENLPQKFCSFFFQPQIEFCTQTNIFRKNFLHANFIFCLHNVVLDIQKLVFFPSLDKFFQTG